MPRKKNERQSTLIKLLFVFLTYIESMTNQNEAKMKAFFQASLDMCMQA